MPYRLMTTANVEMEVKRIATEQLERAIGELDDDSLDDHETVHQVRKRCKKIRGLLRLVRPAIGSEYSKENRFYRDAARQLSPIRDAEAATETFDDLVDAFGELIDGSKFHSIREELERRRSEVEDHFEMDERLDEFRETCLIGRANIESWKLDETGFDALAGGLARTYERGRDEFEEAYAEQTSEAFHEWRKRVKYHWYHMRLLRDLWRPVVAARQYELDELSDVLGDEHDLAVLREKIVTAPGAFGDDRTIQATLGLIDSRRGELQLRARPLAERVYAESPKSLARRFDAYWHAWKHESTTSPFPMA